MKLLICTIIFMVCSTTTSAATIYNVNRRIGSGTVIGFIETDGTLGKIQAHNVTDWQLTVTSPNLFASSPASINFATTTTGGRGSPLSATATDLFYDFSIPDTGVFLQSILPGSTFWGFSTYDLCNGRGCIGETIGFHASGFGPAENVSRSGIVSFARVNVVPIPAAAWLFMSALGGLVVAKRKKVQR